MGRQATGTRHLQEHPLLGKQVYLCGWQNDFMRVYSGKLGTVENVLDIGRDHLRFGVRFGDKCLWWFDTDQIATEYQG